MQISVTTTDDPSSLAEAHPDTVVFVSDAGDAAVVTGAPNVRSARVALHAHDPELSAACTSVHTRTVPYAPPPCAAGRTVAA